MLDPRPRDPYVQVTLSVDPAEAEIAEMVLLELGAMGTSHALASAIEGEVPVVGYFRPGDAPGVPQVRACYRQLAAGVRSDPRIDVESKPWRDWARESRAAFRPFPVTDSLTIAPPWERPARPQGDHLIIHPGSAFGLGTHATTRGCLELITPGSGPALDVGTGTGILALRALQCGYEPVIAFDHDPDAVTAARDNAHWNRLGRRLHLFVGEAGALRPARPFSLIVANLFLNPLVSLAATLSEHLTPGGELILSGIRCDDISELQNAFATYGLRAVEQRGDADWAALRMTRTGGLPS